MKRESAIPAAAMPVVLEIRASVPRPETLPEYDVADVGRKPFPDSVLVWRREDGDCICPMGMHPLAGKGMPENEDDFDVLDMEPEDAQRAVVAFRDWWDTRRDPRKAVSAVWGPK